MINGDSERADLTLGWGVGVRRRCCCFPSAERFAISYGKWFDLYLMLRQTGLGNTTDRVWANNLPAIPQPTDLMPAAWRKSPDGQSNSLIPYVQPGVLNNAARLFLEIGVQPVPIGHVGGNIPEAA
jgi:hypothetical protein